MAKFFKIVNFDKFQHYGDRTPPWIKVYNTLLDKYEFGQLSDASKGHLISIWLLASRNKNKLPYDARWIATRIQANSKLNLQELESLGFINSYIEEETTLASCKQSACLEERRGEERREEKTPIPPKGGDGFEKFWDMYPKKVSKGQAERAWKKLKPTEQLQRQILAAVERAMTSVWVAKEKRYIQNPATWLNGQGWLDEIEAQKQDPPTGSWAIDLSAEFQKQTEEIQEDRLNNA